jgi:site-specific DNA recombinase
LPSFIRSTRSSFELAPVQRAAETDLRLKRLYDAIESGVADLDDPALKERIASLKAIRDQAQTDAERAAAMLASSGQQAITLQMVRKFARTARERMQIEGGGYRRDHLRAFAQRVEVADREVRIIGSKSNLLHTLTAAVGAKPAMPGVPSSVLKWRTGRDSNPRYRFRYTRFPSVRLQPLGHLSIWKRGTIAANRVTASGRVRRSPHPNRLRPRLRRVRPRIALRASGALPHPSKVEVSYGRSGDNANVARRSRWIR